MKRNSLKKLDKEMASYVSHTFVESVKLNKFTNWLRNLINKLQLKKLQRQLPLNDFEITSLEDRYYEYTMKQPFDLNKKPTKAFKNYLKGIEKKRKTYKSFGDK